MFIIDARNVNDAYAKGVETLLQVGQKEPSRNGDVIVAPDPFVTQYAKPHERVLFDSKRDANPFFHLIESIWMIAGRQDGKFLDRFVGDFSTRFAEDNGLIHGAYGYRWRHHFGKDQLKEAGWSLHDNPMNRRVVMGMWDPTTDLSTDKRDVPCNTQIFFRGRPGVTGRHVLDMTVCCRSNDIIWGAYGANAVHMSFLMEVVAGLANMDMGVYYQISNNMHVYTDVLNKYIPDRVFHSMKTEMTNPYVSVKAKPLFADCADGDTSHDAMQFINACEKFCHIVSNTDELPIDFSYGHDWIDNTARQVLMTHAFWKRKDRNAAKNIAEKIESPDWRLAVQQWMERRTK